MVKKANSEAELELVHNYIWACRKLEAFIKEYKIDYQLYLAILLTSTNLTNDMSSRELLGEIIINLSSLIEEGKLRKNIAVYEKSVQRRI